MLHDLARRAIPILNVDHGDPEALRALEQTLLDREDPFKVADVSLRRPGAAAVCTRDQVPVQRLAVLVRRDHEEHVRPIAPLQWVEEPRDEAHAIDDGARPFRDRSLDHGAYADGHGPRLFEEAFYDGIGPLANGIDQPRVGLEGRDVERRDDRDLLAERKEAPISWSFYLSFE